jgi:hypothetical protein
MMAKLEAGYQPVDPIEGPNLWHVFTGDRIVWVGPSRPDIATDNGVLGLIDFRNNVLVVGEPFDFSGDFPTFGGFDQGDLPAEATRLCHNGWIAACQLGIPRTVAANHQWRLGA